jgi:zinc D-Ala-D-Ala carboxypeptidase
MNLNYFSLSEFDCPSLDGSGVNMDSQFLTKLESAREIAGIPFKITSGYRTKEHNEDVLKRGCKASKNSSHLIGVAADIAVSSGSERYIVLNALIKAGFKRIGVAKTFIHCDTDSSKPDSVWTY